MGCGGSKALAVAGGDVTAGPATAGTGTALTAPGAAPAPDGTVVPVRHIDTDYDTFNWAHVVGRGHYGKVYKARHRSTGRWVAVKVLERAKSRRERLRLEVEILRRIGRHPNIVELLDMYETATAVQLVFELMAGELFDRLVNSGPYPEPEAAYVTKRLTEALKYLHRRGIVHRDIKPENLLLSSRGPDAEVKLCDFGLSRLLKNNGQEVIHTVCGTWAYSAPEVRINRQPYTHKVDLWSLGVIVYVILAAYHPFDPEGQATEEELQDNIRNCRFDYNDPVWDGVSELAKDLINKLLVLDPVKRLDTRDVLKHPFITTYAAAHRGTTLSSDGYGVRPGMSSSGMPHSDVAGLGAGAGAGIGAGAREHSGSASPGSADDGTSGRAVITATGAAAQAPGPAAGAGSHGVLPHIPSITATASMFNVGAGAGVGTAATAAPLPLDATAAATHAAAGTGAVSTAMPVSPYLVMSPNAYHAIPHSHMHGGASAAVSYTLAHGPGGVPVIMSMAPLRMPMSLSVPSDAAAAYFAAPTAIASQPTRGITCAVKLSELSLGTALRLLDVLGIRSIDPAVLPSLAMVVSDGVIAIVDQATAPGGGTANSHLATAYLADFLQRHDATAARTAAAIAAATATGAPFDTAAAASASAQGGELAGSGLAPAYGSPAMSYLVPSHQAAHAMGAGAPTGSIPDPTSVSTMRMVPHHPYLREAGEAVAPPGGASSNGSTSSGVGAERATSGPLAMQPAAGTRAVVDLHTETPLTAGMTPLTVPTVSPDGGMGAPAPASSSFRHAGVAGSLGDSDGGDGGSQLRSLTSRGPQDSAAVTGASHGAISSGAPIVVSGPSPSIVTSGSSPSPSLAGILSAPPVGFTVVGDSSSSAVYAEGTAAQLSAGGPRMSGASVQLPPLPAGVPRTSSGRGVTTGAGALPVVVDSAAAAAAAATSARRSVSGTPRMLSSSRAGRPSLHAAPESLAAPTTTSVGRLTRLSATAVAADAGEHGDPTAHRLPATSWSGDDPSDAGPVSSVAASSTAPTATFDRDGGSAATERDVTLTLATQRQVAPARSSGRPASASTTATPAPASATPSIHAAVHGRTAGGDDGMAVWAPTGSLRASSAADPADLAALSLHPALSLLPAHLQPSVAFTAVRGGSPTPGAARTPAASDVTASGTAPELAAVTSPAEEEERLGDALEERHTSSASASTAQRTARPALPPAFRTASHHGAHEPEGVSDVKAPAAGAGGAAAPVL